jgi:predicted MFS family arabinose efflux permease
MTLGIGMIGARYGERTLLLAASALMAATGMSFALANESAALIFLIAFLGTITPPPVQFRFSHHSSTPCSRTTHPAESEQIHLHVTV